MARTDRPSDLATRCGRVGLTSVVALAALLSVVALPAPHDPADPAAGRPPAPHWVPAAAVPAQDGAARILLPGARLGQAPAARRCGDGRLAADLGPRGRARCHVEVAAAH